MGYVLVNGFSLGLFLFMSAAEEKNDNGCLQVNPFGQKSNSFDWSWCFSLPLNSEIT